MRPTLPDDTWATISKQRRGGWWVVVGYGVFRHGEGSFAWTERGARRLADRKVAAMKKRLTREQIIHIRYPER